jgi:2-hydroxychromene-2-carboxylate isomerase
VGEVIELSGRRPGRGHRAVPRGPAPRVTFAYDLADPFSYLAAERVERMLGRVGWRPILAGALHGGSRPGGGAWREEAEQRARALRVPLVWPERAEAGFRSAMRVAAYAAEIDRAPSFVLAATRLAYCGGFDLEDPEVLAEAAAVANIGLAECLSAAGDVSRDGPMEAAGRRLLASGCDRLPVVRVGRRSFCGEERLGEASAAVSHTLAAPGLGAPPGA